jgi:iron complex outermembrane receptor protein
MAKNAPQQQDVIRRIALCGGGLPSPPLSSGARASSAGTLRRERKARLWRHRKRSIRGIPAVALIFTVSIGLPGPRAAASEARERSLTDLSIEELMNIQVTSVSKKAQKLSEAPAPIFVITNEDIRRSGARNIPEVLRLAPGVDVATIGGGRYAVSIRGFTNRFGNKLLVLIDGRSIYTPLFSGVVWEAQGPVLEDVERIEVIRGPGAAIWGANAVNGVINIITKHPADTQGMLASGGTGTEDRGFATVRYGGRLSGNTDYRVYGKTEAHAASDDLNGMPGNDRSHTSRAGFRIDQERSDGRLSMQGEAFNETAGDDIAFPQATPDPTQTPPMYAQNRDVLEHNSGGDLLGRWDRTLTAEQDFSLQTSVDFSSSAIDDAFASRLKTFDLQFEHRINLGDRNHLTSGLGYRLMSYRTEYCELTDFTPASGDVRVASGFVQDDIHLTPRALRMTLGAKIEHDTYSGTQFMPDIRLLWNVDSTSQIWLSASKAIRTPSIGERGGTFRVTPLIPPGSPKFQNAIPIWPVKIPDDFGAERLNALQLGYRSELASTLSLDVTAFLHHYQGLRTFQYLRSQAQVAFDNGAPYLFMPYNIYNGLDGDEAGVEGALDWRATDWWRLQTSYSRMRIKHGAPDLDGALDVTPRTLLSVRSSMDIAGTHFDLWLRHDGKRLDGPFRYYIPEFTTLDSQLSWKLPHGLEVALVGKDLLNVRHPEFVSDISHSQALTVERSAYVRVTWTN